MAKQNFSGGTQYYRSGAYANPGSEVNLKNIERQGDVAMGIVQNNFLRTNALLKRESAKQTAAAQEAQNLLDWGLNNQAEMMNDFQQEALKYGVNNESLNKLIEGKISTFSKATIGYKTATDSKERAFYKKQMDAASKTLNSIVPMFQAMESQAASLSNMEDKGNANQGGSLWLANKTGNEILLGQTINAGRGGPSAYQRFTASEDGTLLMSAGANVPAQYKTTQNRKGTFGFYNKKTGKFEKNPDQGQSTTTIDPNYKPQRITDVDAIQFFSRPIPTAPNWKKSITDKLDPLLYDDKGNLKRQFYKTSGETDAGGNAILEEVQKTKYLPNGERVITYVNVPDMEKIGALISNEVEQVGSGYFKNLEETKIIYNMLGNEGDVKAGANNSSLLYGNIEQNAADEILTGFAQFALNTGNFNDIKVREDRVKFDKPDKGGSGSTPQLTIIDFLNLPNDPSKIAESFNRLFGVGTKRATYDQGKLIISDSATDKDGNKITDDAVFEIGDLDKKVLGDWDKKSSTIQKELDRIKRNLFQQYLGDNKGDNALLKKIDSYLDLDQNRREKYRDNLFSKNKKPLPIKR
tara:strand:+ start:96 stop:1835 length:1740 start_codon:yes stop_codon:yes gene_type:complete